MNSTLRKLGYGPQDRVVIIHADDIGMCRAANAAFADLLGAGLVSSAALMVPCPWFPAAAAYCRDHPAADIGVHLTINSEWTPYRWGPISTRDPATGMLDDQGYFHSSVAAALQQADPHAVDREIRAQVARAIAEGLDLTHLDAHMGTIALQPFFGSYLSVAREHRLPLLLAPARFLAQLVPDTLPETLGQYSGLLSELAEEGIPVFDAVTSLPLSPQPHSLDAAKHVIDTLGPGLTMLILHPAQDTPELRAITPDWPSRVSNYQAAMSSELRDYVRDAGVQVIGYRPLRDLLRAM